MANPETKAGPDAASTLVILSSLILPGLGQFLSKKRTRGLLIFLTTALLAYLVNWSFVHQNIGKIGLGGLVTSWLWLPLVLFWVWNVLDARALAARKHFNLLPGILFAAIVLYVIAWNVTDVKFNRLIERFSDARVLATNLLNPDMITMTVNGQDTICAWSCMYTYIGDELTRRPVAGPIRASDNFLQILGTLKLIPAPGWEVKLRLAAPGSEVNTFV